MAHKSECRTCGVRQALGKVWRAVGAGLLPAAISVAAGLATVAPPAQAAARVASVSPSGEVAQVRQVRVRFSEPVVPAGDPRAPAPFALRCNGATPAVDARWASATEWLLDLQQPLAAGSRCTLALQPGFAPQGGPLEGATEFRFSTGGPAVVQASPYPGSEIEEDQHFLLRLTGVPDLASVQRSVWCEVQGLGERIPVQAVQGAARDAVLRSRRWEIERGADPASYLLLRCQRPLPAEAGLRLVWGAGVAAAGQPTLVTRQPQRLAWTVRPRFTAEFSCERENAQAACLPLRPLTLRFSAPVAREQALAARLQGPPGSAPIAPRQDPRERSPFLTDITFAAPLPENTPLRLTLPAGLVDDAGRALANASAFPLAVATGGLPPLAKFAGSGFGIVEAGRGPDEPALLPLTLRHVQADLADASTGGQVAIKRLDPALPDAELLRWLGRLQRDQANAWETRAKPLLAGEADARRAALPQLTGSTPRATEVIGIPLPQRGYHVVEVQSRILGASLLAQREPMYARTGVLVTNLGVHVKRGAASSLVWVTSLDRGRPVAGAQVAVNDCRGKPLWSGRTGADGTARIPQHLASDDDAEACLSPDGLFVTARTADDLAFAFSRWQRGIEAWRFGIPTGGLDEATARARLAHTVLDRSLLRVGETVSMKHFVRQVGEGGAGLGPVPAEALPAELRLTHIGSDTQISIPLQWPPGARAAESRWAIPRNAALGTYELALVRGDELLPSGRLRVEAFRVPLVDARLAGPAGPLVAPAELVLQAQVNALAGGPMAGQAVQVSALLRATSPGFAGYDDFSFDAPQAAGATGEGDDDGEGREPGRRLVADKLAATTDAQGAARITLPGLPPLQAPADLQAELRFADPNGETQTVSRTLRLWPAAVVAGIRVASWAATKEQARFSAVVLDTSGKPLAGRDVTVQGQALQTFSTRKRIVGGFYSYDNQRELRDLGPLCSGKTDARGRLDCNVKIDTSGEVQLVVQAKDDAGRLSQAAASLWLAGPGDWWFAQGNDDRIELLPEQRSVEPGQTARLQVRMPFRQATALVTVEREGVLDARVVQLSGREPVLELPVPRDAAAGWAPNVTVSVLVLRGRLRDAPWWSLFTWGWKEPGEWWQAFRYEGQDWRAPTALADLAKPSFKLGAASLEVGLAAHRLDVAVVPERTQYTVRETVRTTVRVTHAGQPVHGAQVAFAAVDEGLLALQDNDSWDLLGALLRPRPWSVETATAQGEIIGRRHYGRKALPPGGGGGRNPTRELFDTLLLWRGTVTMDAQGQAVVEVPLNDSLTRFRLVAVADDASTGVQRFGTGSAVVRATRDLQMLPGLPPLVREGDRFEAGFTLRNTTGRAMQVQATLQGRVEGLALAGMAGAPGFTAGGAAGPARSGGAAATPAAGRASGSAAERVAGGAAGGAPGGPAGSPAPAGDIRLPPQTVQLAAGAALELRWPVEVPSGAVRITWTGSAVEAGGSSAPARDDVRLVQAVQAAVPLQVWQGSLQGLQGTVNWPVAPPADALPGRSQTVVTLSPRLATALPGLKRWFEAYPYTCLEQKTSRALALRDDAGWQSLRDELPGYLDSDGLASYFPPSPGSPARGSDRLTAYLLASAHQAGWFWPDAPRDAMLAGLAAFVEGRIERRYTAPRPDLDVRKWAALEALARHGRAHPRMLGSIAWNPAVWPTATLLDAWSVLSRVNGIPERAARGAELQRLIRSRLVAGGTTLAFSTEAEDAWWWLMDSADLNAARLLLVAVDHADWREDLPRLLTGTLARQRKGAWGTTTANLWGVLALERFGTVHESTPVSGVSHLQLGQAQARHDWQAQPEGDVIRFAGPSQAGAFSARHEGPGQPWLSVQMLAAVPLQQPLAAGYRIRKTLSPVQQKQPGAWSRGDTVRVRLEVEAVGDMGWVVVSDPVPAGATLLGSGLGRDSALATQGEQRAGSAWLAHEERAADAWRAYYEWMPRGKQVMEYTLRLNTAGRLHLPPTRVEAMYAPDSFGALPNAPIEVRP